MIWFMIRKMLNCGFKRGLVFQRKINQRSMLRIYFSAIRYDVAQYFVDAHNALLQL